MDEKSETGMAFQNYTDPKSLAKRYLVDDKKILGLIGKYKPT